MGFDRYPHVEAGFQYAKACVSGSIPASKWTKLACQRQLDDFARWGEIPGKHDYWFDVEAAERFCRTVEMFRHVKGRGFAGNRIILEPWQNFTFSTVFGWKRGDGMRRFRTAYNEIPRKNAKSTMSAPVGLIMLASDGEPGAEIYSAATTRDQAKIIWDVARRMAERESEFRYRYGVRVLAHSIVVEDSASSFVPLSSDADSLDGKNVHGGLVDELHAHSQRYVWDSLETGMGARQQPLLWAITTAGVNMAGICYEQRSYVTKILERAAVDETYFGIIWTIDDGDDPFSEETWRKANPNFGVSVNPDDLKRLATKARQLPSALANFLTKRMDVWCQSDDPWMPMQAWHRCGDPKLKIEDFAGDPAWIAVDLASRRDMAAVVIVFKRGKDFYSFEKYYLPDEAIEESQNSQYRGWADSGHITETEGAVIDFEQIEDDVQDLMRRFRFQRLGGDPSQFQYFGQRLAKQWPSKIVEIPQHINRLSPPMKELEALVVEGRWHHAANPVTAWMMSNVRAHRDMRRDEIFPVKEAAANKIDGPVAMIMALSMGMANNESKPWAQFF